MAGVAQLVRASDCGSEGRGFEPRYSPHFNSVVDVIRSVFFCSDGRSFFIFIEFLRNADCFRIK